MNCEECKYYSIYYEYCRKYNCEINERAVYNCFEPYDKPILRAMIHGVHGVDKEQ